MKRNWWLIIILSITLGITYPFVFKKNTNSTVIINNKTIKVELARTDTERAKGLSGRDYLADDSGMLFIFPKADIYSFWMKDTLIPLDIIWIESDPSTSLGTGKIVEMTTLNPASDNNIPQYTPQNKAQYVLELNTNSGFKVGDEVKISIN